MIVVDASAIVDLLMGNDRAGRVADAMGKGGTLVSLSHVFVEVASALARLERAGTLTRGDAAACMGALARLPVEAIDGQKCLPAVWAYRQRLRIADAFYVGCALLFDTPLLTCDGRLARGAKGLVPILHIV